MDKDRHGWSLVITIGVFPHAELHLQELQHMLLEDFDKKMPATGSRGEALVAAMEQQFLRK